MTWGELFVWAPAFTLSAAALAAVLYRASLPPQARWRHDMEAQGAPYSRIRDEAALRIALARLRRVASDAALAGQPWEAAANAEIGETIEAFKSGDTEQAKRYRSIVAGMDVEDILFEDALRHLLAQAVAAMEKDKFALAASGPDPRDVAVAFRR